MEVNAFIIMLIKPMPYIKYCLWNKFEMCTKYFFFHLVPDILTFCFEPNITNPTKSTSSTVQRSWHFRSSTGWYGAQLYSMTAATSLGGKCSLANSTGSIAPIRRSCFVPIGTLSELPPQLLLPPWLLFCLQPKILRAAWGELLDADADLELCELLHDRESFWWPKIAEKMNWSALRCSQEKIYDGSKS